MSNPDSKVTLRLSPKRKRTRANKPLNVRSPIGFNICMVPKPFFIINFIMNYLHVLLSSKKSKLLFKLSSVQKTFYLKLAL